MTTTQKRKVLQRIQEIEADLVELKRCRIEIAKAGYSQATLSSSTGTKSYTRLDLNKISDAIQALTSELEQLRHMLSDTPSQGLWKNVHIVFS